ncbi:lytic transglycosylase domain-containing protein [Silvibacterium acidisoli]|uniref:lytic transglycosylase domain-containing protein n=1 Tax=Acidobacteriaceae bacterium ZG23-2 TaxID=2883246 RepID=UPI00406CA15F
MLLTTGAGAQSHKTAAHKKTSTTHKSSATKASSTRKAGAASKRGGHAARSTSRAAARRRSRKPLNAAQRARSEKLQQAFVASSQLRPMSQQLATMRSPAAYAGVSAYAHSHTGEAAAAAYLALGHAYLLDRKFPEAVAALRSANEVGKALDDYADYLTAQVYLQSNQLANAEDVLNKFIQKHPDSIFVASVPVLEANLFLQEGDPQAALRALAPHRSESIANKADFQLADAKATLMAGRSAEAQQIFRRVYLNFPLSNEAAQARTQLVSSGTINSLPAEERRHHADSLYDAKRYSDAEEEYRSLANDPSISADTRNTLLVAAAACEWKLKSLRKGELDLLPDTATESGARRLYLLMELARDKDDGDTQRSIVQQMESRFPESPWLAEALYSSGNMYLLRKDFPTAIQYYGELAKRFPRSCESPHSGPCSNYSPSSHWRAAWLNYRLGQYAEAARLFDEQIQFYRGGKEIPAALYWRGRVYDQEEHKPAMAAAYYQAVSRVYRHYYYAALADQRLTALGSVSPASFSTLNSLEPESIPELSDDVPEDDPHVVKARLLANAGLNEYIAPEIRAADGSREWGAFAEAEIYSSYGETAKAVRLLKRAIPFYTSAPVDSMPLAYWHILFPQPYWGEIKESSERNGLDPYMVASLIRQESEFNPLAVSNKNAYGLMQLLPSVGKSMAKQEGIHGLRTDQLLDPIMNIRLGTRYLRQTLDKFGGHPEYAFAAYNAGDNRVTDWQSIGNYRDMDEFVESIPFTETRDYVQAIIRNQEIYREVDKASSQRAANQ